MPIYTKTGDDGQTGLFGNRRVPKDDARIEAYGTVDEVNAILGMLRAELSADQSPTVRQIQTIQDTLFESAPTWRPKAARRRCRGSQPPSVT